jgi:hypothetical protein
MGYIPSHNRVYLADKDVNIYGYSLSLNLVEYQTAVLSGDMDAAAEILPALPRDQLNKVARFLEGRGWWIVLITLSNHRQALRHRPQRIGPPSYYRSGSQIRSFTSAR